ncbi:MAG: DNA gyrase inhibitor YacG [Planctomycetia bacterium]|nr:DNA gyrase inhibitor YacG [Planctomycetia bacterium]
MPRCPVCSVPVDLTAVVTPPFCSERCRLVDLGRWLDESYAVPEVRGRADDDERDGNAGDGEAPAAPPSDADD